MAEHGSGFDVVSGGELYRVEVAGGAPDRTVFAGVGKTDEEIAAGLKAGVLMFNVESEAELDAIARVADVDRDGGAGRAAGQPGRRPQDAPVHLDGQEGVEVRHGHRPLAGPGRAVEGAEVGRR